MSNEFINEIQFNKKVNLKRPKREKDGEKKKSYGTGKKLLRLIYFFTILAAFFFGGRFAIQGVVSFCQGTEFQSWEEMTESYRKFNEE